MMMKGCSGIVHGRATHARASHPGTAVVESLQLVVRLLVHVQGVNIRACGISTSNRWCSACDLTLTTAKASNCSVWQTSCPCVSSRNKGWVKR